MQPKPPASTALPFRLPPGNHFSPSLGGGRSEEEKKTAKAKKAGNWFCFE
jgi:hypothetical protein